MSQLSRSSEKGSGEAVSVRLGIKNAGEDLGITQGERKLLNRKDAGLWRGLGMRNMSCDARVASLPPTKWNRSQGTKPNLEGAPGIERALDANTT